MNTGNFRKFGLILAVAFMSIMTTGCYRIIPTGEAGLRIDFNNQVVDEELLPGSWNQTVIGKVLTFPVREIPVEVNDRHPLTSDNSPMGEFAVTVVYSVNPSYVSDIYSKKSKAFHVIDKNGEILLMHRYIETLIVNAENIAVRKYKSLEVNDHRNEIEASIREHIITELKHQKLADYLTISAVQIRAAVPNAEVQESSSAYVVSQGELKIKENEVKIAILESERMAALAKNAEQSIAYMGAQVQQEIAKGVSNGKINTIIIPMDFNVLADKK